MLPSRPLSPHQGFVVRLPGGIPLRPVLHTLNLSRAASYCFFLLCFWGVETNMENINININIYIYIKYIYITYNIISYHHGEIIISFFSDFGCWILLQPRNSMRFPTKKSKKRAALARDTMSQVVRECRLAVPWVTPT